MYQISTKVGVLGFAENPDYCFKLPISGAPQVIGRRERARRETATGVIYHGSIYNLPGHNDFDGETVMVSEIDAGTVLNAQRDAIAAQKEQSNAIEDALCEEDTAAAARIAAIEDALCELDKEETV